MYDFSHIFYVEKANSMFALCEKNGWTAVSMKNDWKTIYGEDVKRVLFDKRV